ncbi:UDP-glucuronic acid decarboxylase family protein [Thioclava atlantica]|uniref:NAD-dependent epimerase/dehydratase n=1 Tax=Thioclava atlantica TaxID=1317124 RepID=A0A085TUT4_9RHOB|nr:UDP-glucuronic acid decarboxylase family protein [Thioclava atlantica]KFE34481.1 NAD-dependent epimerase/dehydratase [Thioclava atlantica]
MSDKRALEAPFPRKGAASGDDLPTGRTVLIAGGAGFIGSNLSRRLLARGDRVICVDNLETGRTENIAGLLTNPSFAFILHDIIEAFTVHGPVDRIYNLACPASPPKYQRNPLHTLETSFIGALNLLDIAEKKGARILQSSTSEVYGDPDISPQAEDYRGLVNTVGPRACYDEGKRVTETLFYEAHHSSDIDVRIARIFNTYGPRMDPEDGRVVSNFVVQALRGEPLTVYGEGTQTRSFCYVDDMVDGLMALMEADEVEPTIFDPVNLGNPGEFTMLELAELVLELTGSASTLSFHPLPQDDPLQRRPDISRAKALLDWEPKVSLYKGLAPTIAYFREEIAQRQQELGRTA